MNENRLIGFLAGRDTEVRRQIRYFVIAAFVYVIGAVLLVVEAALGSARPEPVQWLLVALVVGVVGGYLLIRATPFTGLTSHQNTMIQMVYSLGCIVAAYAVVGTVRGGVLTILIVSLMFGAFSASLQQMAAVCALAIALLGATMLLMVRLDPARHGAVDEISNFVLTSTMLVVVAYLSSRLAALRRKLFDQKTELVEALARVRILATRDELTGLMNRRSMVEALKREHVRQGREGGTIAIALIDLDWFKEINDSRGHAVGDEVLGRFGQLAVTTLRQSDVVSRWGGEEFLVAFPDCEVAAAESALQRLHEVIRDYPVSASDPQLRLSFSAGLTLLRPDESIEDMLECADRAMYLAKTMGRQRTVVDTGLALSARSGGWQQLALFGHSLGSPALEPLVVRTAEAMDGPSLRRRSADIRRERIEA
ncbi:MAG: GGDEF domain-containing protein [Burkholderiaceae bacterium]